MGDTLGYRIREFEPKWLSKITNGFVRNFQFGKVYHGVYACNDDNTLYHLHKVLPADNVTRLMIVFPGQRGSRLPLELLLYWNIPFLLYLIPNVDAAHIMLNQDDNPILFDLSMITGGVVTDRRKLINQQVVGCYGYVDPNCARQGKWSDKCDVLSFGVLLLSLISKRVDSKGDDASDTPSVFEWAKSEYIQRKSTMGSGTSLKRPTIKQVVRYLGNLHAVQLHASNFAIDQTLPVPSYNTKVFRGRIEEWPVTVKVWELQCCYKVEPGHNEGRVRDEIVLLQHAKLVYHPNLVKLIGYCYEGEKLGVVYDLNPLDTVYNLVAKGIYCACVDAMVTWKTITMKCQTLEDASSGSSDVVQSKFWHVLLNVIGR
ncbi:unnamed protein product [Dovyalis caffra]|uniref:Protein kinase domain-containing protein n=1 Tax=Dovyalis caffra TaxID=77055 RepID=A0AAV1SIB6_9ROSI|nr:unnamed protein product [Dovyalis caffra]